MSLAVQLFQIFSTITQYSWGKLTVLVAYRASGKAVRGSCSYTSMCLPSGFLLQKNLFLFLFIQVLQYNYIVFLSALRIWEYLKLVFNIKNWKHCTKFLSCVRCWLSDYFVHFAVGYLKGTFCQDEVLKGAV